MCFAVISAKIQEPVISGVDKFAPFGVVGGRRWWLKPQEWGSAGNCSLLWCFSMRTSGQAFNIKLECANPVSYTHLTLPTIYSV